jgi:hypothetical protein
MTSVVIIRGWGVRFGVVSGWVQFGESSRGWPKPGVSPRRRIRQNAQKKCPKYLGDGTGRGTSAAEYKQYIINNNGLLFKLKSFGSSGR